MTSMFTYYTNTNIIPTRFVHHSEPNGIRKNWRVELQNRESRGHIQHNGPQ